jgi:hypothetical protein
MKKSMIKRALGIFGMFVLTMLLMTCSDEIQEQEIITNGKDKVVVSFFIMDDMSRSVLPQVSLENVSSYKLFGGKVGEIETLLLEFSKEQTTVSVEIMPGTWNFTLNAYNNNNEHILQGKVINRQINLTESNSVSFSLSVFNSGVGNIYITLNFPQEAGITRISTSGDAGIENFNSISNGSLIYTKNNIASGDYFISFELYQGNVLRTVVSELVIVQNNLSSSKTITLVGNDLKPVLSGSVSIIGTVLVGEVLTVNTSSLNGVENVSYQWKKNGSDISGATNASYAIVSADVGGTITVTVTCLGYIGDVTSPQTIAVPALINASLNSVTGDGNTTQTTTLLTLTFNQTVTGLSPNEIIISTTNVAGTIVKGIPTASGSAYTLPISGFSSGGSLTVSIEKPGYNITGSHSVTIHCYSPPLTGTVGINGALQTGQILTADTSNLNGNGGITYQWKRGTTIVGTNSNTYTVVAADVGNTNFTLTVTRANYSDSVTSLPMLTGTTSITGTLQINETLTAVTTGLGGSGDISYQWLRGTTNIGNNRTYTIQSADVGATITLIVTRTDNSGRASTTTTTIGLLTGTVNITGDAIVGQTLTANTSSLGGSGTISYKWWRDTTNIGTNSSTYTVVAADVGSRITVVVTRANNSSSVTSSQTATVTLPPLTGAVSITGTAAVGQSLSVNTTSLGGSGTISYQWMRHTSQAGGTTTNITSATNASYTVQLDDQDRWLSVTVSRANNSGSVTSERVRVVVKTWSWNTSTPPAVGNYDIIVIASGASGTLVAPENSTVTIVSTGNDFVNNESRQITLNASAGAKVIWRANYQSTANNAVSVVGTGTLDVAAGNIITTSNRAIYTTANCTIIVSGGAVSAWPNESSWNTAVATIMTTSASSTVNVSGGQVIAHGNGGNKFAINAAGILNISGGLVIAEAAITTGTNGVINKEPNLSGTGTIVGYTLGGSYSTGSTSNLVVLATTGHNVYWGLRDSWETGIYYRGNFFPRSGVSVGNRVVWNSNRIPEASSIASGSSITIAAGASGTMAIQDNASVTIVSQGSNAVNNASNGIGLNIGTNAKVTWRANYNYSNTSYGSVSVNVSGNGTFEIPAGSINATTGVTGVAISASSSNSIIVSGGIISTNLTGINSMGNVTVSSGEIHATDYAIYSNYGYGETLSNTITISGGVVSVTTGRAISSGGGGYGTNTSTIVISGGAVNATTGTAIYSTSTSETDAVHVSGGVVSAATGQAINAHVNGRFRVTGGLVVAQRSVIVGASDGVINRNLNAISGNGTVVGYSLGAYTAGSTTGLVYSGAAVSWRLNGNQPGISYPGGFYAVSGVSVIGTGGATVVFNEDFESTSSFTIVNGTQTNQWYVGNATAYGGTKSVYISNDSGASNAYSHSTSTVHMYRNVTFTSSSTPYRLGFYWKAQGESTAYDCLKVYLTETSFTPVAGTRPTESTTVVLIGTYVLGGINNWNYANIDIPATNSGTTKRLVLTWYNDASGGTQPPIAVDNIMLTR